MVTVTKLFDFMNTKALWMVIKKEKLLTFNFILTLIESLSDQFVAQKW